MRQRRVFVVGGTGNCASASSFSPSVSSDNRTLVLSNLGVPAASTISVIVTHAVTDLSGNALADFQSQRVLDAQQPFLDTLDTWDAWDAWRNSVVAYYSSQPCWGCPIGAMTSELSGNDPELAAEVAEHMDRWRGYLQRGLTRMLAAGRLRAGADPETLALATFASLQGGLLLAQSMQSAKPLAAALDAALIALRSATEPTSRADS